MKDDQFTGFEEPSSVIQEDQFQRIHTFRGSQLAPYGFGVRAALFRIGEGSALPSFEEACYLVFLLLKKTPAQVDTIRTAKQISAFRQEAGEWAEREQVMDGEGWKELYTLALSILEPVSEANKIEPAPVAGKPSIPHAVAGKE